MKEILLAIDSGVAIVAGGTVVGYSIVVADWLLTGSISDDPRAVVTILLLAIAALALMLANIGALYDKP